MRPRLAVLTIFAFGSTLLLAAGPIPVSAGGTVRHAAATATPVTPNGSWPVYHHDDAHTGYDSSSSNAITAVPGWTSPTLDQSVYGEPLVYNGIVYVATLNNTVYALNQTDGSIVWSSHLAAPVTGGWQCGFNVAPQGVVGTPVIDPAGGRIYAAILDGADHLYYLEGLSLTTGALQFSVVITTQALSGFDWTIQQQRGALAIHGGYVYIPFGGRDGDCGPYRGWIFAVPTAGGGIAHYVTPGLGSGFWAAGGVVVDDSTGKVFDTTGNGVASGCDANPDGSPVYENDAVVRLSALLVHEDYFMPYDWQSDWCGNDEDLGSASMVLISPTLAFQAGKWGQGFLLNPQSLGGVDGQLYPSPANGVDVCFGNHSAANFGSYAYAAPDVYLSCDGGHGLVGLPINTSTPSFPACSVGCTSPVWTAGSGLSFGPPIVAGGAVWAIETGGGGLYGFDASTGAQIYHSTGFSATHFSTPSEAGGEIFAAAGNQVLSFDMSAGCKSVKVAATPSASSAAGTSVTIVASGISCPNPNPLYEFWLKAPGAGLYTLAQAYSTSSTFSWNTTGLTTGSYQVNVWVKDAGGNGVFGNSYGRWDAYNAGLSYLLTGCSSVSDSAAPQGGAMPGSTVTISAVATGCTNPQYEFWILRPGASLYTLAQAYSSTATLSWATAGLAAGTYRINVWVKDANSGGAAGNSYGAWDTYDASLLYNLTAGCPSANDSAAPISAAMKGMTVTFTATVNGGCPNPQFEFWILSPGSTLYTLAQAYSSSSTFSWSTASNGSGSYRVNVWVKDASSTGVYGNAYGRWDAYNAGLTYTVTSGCPSVGDQASPPSGSPAGTTVTITASAPGCPNPRYEFWVLAPGSSLYTLAQPYGSSGTFAWNTSGLAKGTYRINVWVEDASSAGTGRNPYGSWDAYNASMTYTLS